MCNPKTKSCTLSSVKKFNAKTLKAHRTLQHDCKARKAYTQKPTLEKSCNYQHGEQFSVRHVFFGQHQLRQNRWLFVLISYRYILIELHIL